MLNGLDLSGYQHATPSLVGMSFVWAKATEGTAYADPQGMKLWLFGGICDGASLAARSVVPWCAGTLFKVGPGTSEHP